MEDIYETRIKRLLCEVGMIPYKYFGVIYYDTVNVFDRHNFARNVKRSIDDYDWLCKNNKYYLTERGVITYIFVYRHDNLKNLVMRELQTPYQMVGPSVLNQPNIYTSLSQPPGSFTIPITDPIPNLDSNVNNINTIIPPFAIPIQVPSTQINMGPSAQSFDLGPSAQSFDLGINLHTSKFYYPLPIPFTSSQLFTESSKIEIKKK